MTQKTQRLVRRFFRKGYAHNCPKTTGWLTPISHNIDNRWKVDEDLIEYIDNLPNKPMLLIFNTKYGKAVAEVTWCDELPPEKVGYSIQYEWVQPIRGFPSKDLTKLIE